MDVEIDLLEEVLLQAQLFGSGAHEGKGQIGTLLHDLTQLPGELEVPFARQAGGLDGEKVATRGGPGEAVDHAGRGLVAGRGLQEPLRAQEPGQALWSHMRLEGFSGQFASAGLEAVPGKLAQDGADLPLQLPDPGFLGVGLDHLLQGLVCEGDTQVHHAVAFQGLGHEMLLGDGQLLPPGVAREFDDLQAILQGLGDLMSHVGRA